MHDTITTTRSVLRDVSMRFEQGQLVQVWAVLPENEHYDAVLEMLRIFENQDPVRWVTSASYVHHGLCWNLVATSKNVGAMFDVAPHPSRARAVRKKWHVDRDGRMLTLTRTLPKN